MLNLRKLSTIINLDNDEYVGIGTSVPEKKLHVKSINDISISDPKGSIRIEDEYIDQVNAHRTSTWDIEPDVPRGTAQNQISFTELVKLNIGTPGMPVLTLTADGKVGIGTKNPQAKLEVKGSISVYDGDGNTSLFFGRESAPTGISGKWGIQYVDPGEISLQSLGELNFWIPYGNNIYGNNFMFLADDGNVGIGTADPHGYKLAVNGHIIATGVIIQLHNDWTNYPDFVFSNNYKMIDLSELQEYIKKNNHLPDIPTAKEVSESGLDLGEMNKKLLQKIEELTLYIIQQDERIKKLEEAAKNSK